MVNKRSKSRRRASLSSRNVQQTATPRQHERRHSDAITSTKTSEVSSAEPVIDDSQALPTPSRLAVDGDVTAMEEGGLKDGKKKVSMMSPRLDAQLGGYPPDCGTKELKYLSYAKVLRDRGMTHPMRYSSTRVDALGFAMPERHPLLSTDFGAHSFHHLPTDSVVLSQYGLGIALYFKYLKVITWLFLLLVVISAPALAVYIVGGGTSIAELTALARQDLPSVLGITSIGHLSEASSVCDQALENTEVSLSCAAGEIGFVKAVYSTYDAQGSCSCPERNKVSAGSGQCRGDAEGSACPADGAGCFLGVHPVSLQPCCSFSRNESMKTPLFDEMRIRESDGCGSNVAQQIVQGLCLGKKSCTLNVSEEITYAWEPEASYGTNCSESPTVVTIDSVANITKEVCEVQLNDDSDYSKCEVGKPRALIVYGRCFTTRIDLSSAWSLKIIGWDSMSRREFLGLAVGCDIACSLVFFFVVVWLRRKEKEAGDRIAQNQIQALDYTVQLVDLPHHDDLNLLRQEIRLHLEAVLTNAPPFAVELDRIRVADVQFGKSASRHLRLLGRRGAIVRRLEIAQQRHEKLKLLSGRLEENVYARRERRHLRAIHKLETKLHLFNVKLEHWHIRQKRQNISQAVTAFVTFEEEEGFHRCLQEYPDLGWLHRLFQPYYKRLHGKRLRFRPAPDPTDIIWENLHHPFLERLFRQLIVTLITLAVLFLSFVLIFVAKEQKSKLERQFGRPTSCPANVFKTDVIQDELSKASGLVPYKALLECYCKNFLVDHSFKSMMYESFRNPDTGDDDMLCRTWATTFVTTQVLSIASVLLVVAVNLILARVLNGLVALEKHHTQSSLVVSRVTKVFLAQFCNTALLMLAINANAKYFSSSATSADNGGFSIGALQVLNGAYADFSADWYNDVGVALMLTMIINSFSTHAYLFANYTILKARRFLDRGFSFDHSLTKQDTQRDLEALYRGPKFDLAARYAQSLTSIFITYMFSAGMPLLHFIGFGAMIMTYWADKFTFLRVARSPPLYDGKVASAAGSLLPYAVLMHCLVAMWMFSNDRIFEAEQEDFSVTNSTGSPGDGIPLFDAASRGQLISRVTRPQVVVLFAFFVAGCATVIMRTVLFEYVPALVRSVLPALARLLEKPRVAKGIPNYFDAIPTSCLQEKLATSGTQLLRPDIRAKYERALVTRIAHEALPKKRSMRSLSATERFNQVNWIVGCPSYAISDNKEYIAKLAIDSHLSEEIPLDQIF